MLSTWEYGFTEFGVQAPLALGVERRPLGVGDRDRWPGGWLIFLLHTTRD
jgi:hypothetical protein